MPRKAAASAAILAFIIQRVSPDSFPDLQRCVSEIEQVRTTVSSANPGHSALGDAIQWNLAKIYHKLSANRASLSGFRRKAANAYWSMGELREPQALPFPVLLTGANIDLPEDSLFEATSPAVLALSPAWRYQFAAAISFSYDRWKQQFSHEADEWNCMAKLRLKEAAGRISVYMDRFFSSIA